jgi:peptidoglycan/LPS O-acetylase OafA/YrhL
MSASRPNLSLRKFMIARLGRLYSVLVPALLFSYLVYFYLNYFTAHNEHLNEHSNNLVTRFFVNLFFLSQCWSLSSTPPINNPFWSVDYEFFYYLIIASLLLIKGSAKYIYILICMAIAGFKILLLAPCWLIGSLLFKMDSRKVYFSSSLSLIVFLISSFLIIQIISGTYTLPFTKLSGDQVFLGHIIYFSWNFRADYIFSLIIALNLFSAFGLSEFLHKFSATKFTNFLHLKIQFVSNCTYTLYLFHFPLLLLFSSFGFYDHSNNYHLFGLMSSVLIAVVLIAKHTEFKVSFWRGWVEKTIAPVESIFTKAKNSIILLVKS